MGRFYLSKEKKQYFVSIVSRLKGFTGSSFLFGWLVLVSSILGPCPINDSRSYCVKNTNSKASKQIKEYR